MQPLALVMIFTGCWLVVISGRCALGCVDMAVDRHGGDTAGCGDFGHGESAGVVHSLGKSGVIFGLRPPVRPRA